MALLEGKRHLRLQHELTLFSLVTGGISGFPSLPPARHHIWDT
jgi:hypothetical protein